jgi:hypothetical protein
MGGGYGSGRSSCAQAARLAAASRSTSKREIRVLFFMITFLLKDSKKWAVSGKRTFVAYC